MLNRQLMWDGLRRSPLEHGDDARGDHAVRIVVGDGPLARGNGALGLVKDEFEGACRGVDGAWNGRVSIPDLNAPLKRLRLCG